MKKLILVEITECVVPFILEFCGLHLLPVNNNIKILKTVLLYMCAKLDFRHWRSTCTEDIQEQGVGEITRTNCGQRGLHNDNLYDLYIFLNTV